MTEATPSARSRSPLLQILNAVSLFCFFGSLLSFCVMFFRAGGPKEGTLLTIMIVGLTFALIFAPTMASQTLSDRGRPRVALIVAIVPIIFVLIMYMWFWRRF